MEKRIPKSWMFTGRSVAFEYYKQHLEKYNAAFAAQVNEFRDGNLLFEIMQRQIWNRAAADSAGLKKYFEAHKKITGGNLELKQLFLMLPICRLRKKLAEGLKRI